MMKTPSSPSRRIPAAAAALSSCLGLLLAPSAVEASGGSNNYTDLLTYQCTFDLIGYQDTPIYSEREVLHFRTCYVATAATFAGEGEDDRAYFEYFELVGQEWDANYDDGAAARRRGARRTSRKVSRDRVSGRTKCRKCRDETPTNRRRDMRNRSGRDLLSFESAFLGCLQESHLYEQDGKYGDFPAFENLESASFHCDVEPSDPPPPPPSDVLSDTLFYLPQNASGHIEECTCTTSIENASVPILTEPEFARFDHCWIDSWNAYHSNSYGDAIIVASEILDQNPHGMEGFGPGDGAGAPGGGAARRLGSATADQKERKLGKCRKCRNEILSRKATCRNCKDEQLVNRRRRKMQRSLEDALDENDLVEFDAFLCDCLRSGNDGSHPDGAAPYEAYPDGIVCGTSCSKPLVTLQEFEETQQAQKRSFEEAKLAKLSEFEYDQAEAEAELEAEMALIEAKKLKLKDKLEEFNQAREDEEKRFAKYQELELRAFREEEAESCVKVVDKRGCDDVNVQRPLRGLADHEEFVDLEIVQNFNMGLNGECMDTGMAKPLRTTKTATRMEAMEDTGNSTMIEFLVQYDHPGDSTGVLCRRTRMECGETVAIKDQCAAGGVRTANVKFMIRTDFLPTTYEKQADAGAGALDGGANSEGGGDVVDDKASQKQQQQQEVYQASYGGGQTSYWDQQQNGGGTGSGESTWDASVWGGEEYDSDSGSDDSDSRRKLQMRKKRNRDGTRTRDGTGGMYGGYNTYQGDKTMMRDPYYQGDKTMMDDPYYNMDNRDGTRMRDGDGMGGAFSTYQGDSKMMDNTYQGDKTMMDNTNDGPIGRRSDQCAIAKDSPEYCYLELVVDCMCVKFSEGLSD